MKPPQSAAVVSTSLFLLLLLLTIFYFPVQSAVKFMHTLYSFKDQNLLQLQTRSLAVLEVILAVSDSII